LSTAGRVCILIALIAGIRVSVLAQSLSARTEGERLRIVIDRPRFLSGDALRRLYDGVPVTYVFKLSAHNSRLGNAMTRSEYRFIISYDIFEEKFQVSRIRPTGRVISHLTAAAAETTFIDALELSIKSLGTGMFWLRLEYQAEESSGDGNPGVSIEGLVEIFSRTTTKEPTRGVLESGPLRLSDLPRSAPPRGTTSP
jgi:hypothetical protein